MHPSPVFRQTSRERNLAFARERGFGVLAVGGEGAAGPLLSHIPFVLAEDGGAVHAHLVRANPIARCLAGGEQAAVRAVGGPARFFTAKHPVGDGELSQDYNLAPNHEELAKKLAG